MSRNLTPVQVAERFFGKPEAIAAITGDNPKTPFAWHHPSKWRRGGDLPNTEKQRLLLNEARRRNLPLAPEWLIFGASAADVDAAIAAAASGREAA